MKTAIQVLNELDPDEIRDRLSDLTREEKGLKVLLRAALRRKPSACVATPKQEGHE